MTTKSELAAALDELIEAAIAWEAGDERDEDRLSDAVHRFQRARGDFSGEVRKATSNMELFALLVGVNVPPDAAGAAVRESA